GKCGAVIERAAKAAIVEQPFRCAIEGDAHAVEKIDDSGSSVAHALDEGLVGKEIAAIDRVIEVLRGGVAFTLLIFRGVDATLRPARVRTLHRHNRKQLDGTTRFGHLDGGHQSRQTTTDNDDSRLVHFVMYEENGCQSSRKLSTMSTPTTLKSTPTATPSC